MDVDTFADDVPLGRPAVLPAGAERAAEGDGLGDRRGGRRGGRPGDGAGVVDPGRAPAGAIARAGGHSGRRYRVDSGDEPNPSERVRELVRRDPEAAASVLQRWTTQGGRVS